jgi:DNA sulfur modification protein DndD
VEVFTDTQPDKELSEHWDEFIEGYIPSGIAHLFFFDAEQIKELAEGEHAAQILGTAIHTLLGLDLVDQLEMDLVVLERRKRAEARSAEETRRIEAAEQERDRMLQLLDAAKIEQGTLDTDVRLRAKEMAAAEEAFRREGGELYLVRAELESQHRRLKAEMEKEEAALRELAAGATPLLLIPHLLQEAETLARKEQDTRRAQLLAATLEERDTVLLKKLRKENLPSKYAELIEQWLTQDRSQRQARTGPLVLGDRGDALATDLRHLSATVLPEAQTQIDQRLTAITGLQERLTRLDVELARVPAKEVIAGLQRELEGARERQQAAQVALVSQEDKIRLLVRQCEDAERKLKRELGEGVEGQVDREHAARLLKHSERVRETMAKFRIAAIRKHTGRLERLILESFVQLLRKSSLVTGLKIDPATFRIELTGGDGQPLPFERLSAGERQLLATSILWGLARASGRPLPTIIDTPLGRLDSSHRRHLLERYFPVASHQVILLSTDEEIDETSLKQLKRFVGREYQLSFDERSRSTEITKGYFWNYEATA